MDFWTAALTRVVPRLLELAGTRVYEVYYLPQHPSAATGVLLGLCDIIPPELLLLLIVVGILSIIWKILCMAWWAIRTLRDCCCKKRIVTREVGVGATPIPTSAPSHFLIQPTPPQLSEFARLVAPYLVANQLTALHQPHRPHLPSPPQQPASQSVEATIGRTSPSPNLATTPSLQSVVPPLDASPRLTMRTRSATNRGRR